MAIIDCLAQRADRLRTVKPVQELWSFDQELQTLTLYGNAYALTMHLRCSTPEKCSCARDASSATPKVQTCFPQAGAPQRCQPDCAVTFADGRPVQANTHLCQQDLQKAGLPAGKALHLLVLKAHHAAFSHSHAKYWCRLPNSVRTWGWRSFTSPPQAVWVSPSCYNCPRSWVPL